jgi:hypothetical protein
MNQQALNTPRVDFMVPGFSKCGTTSLCDLLAGHPDIYIPEAKESNIFAYEDYADRWGDYRGFFKDVGNQKMVGEGGTFYTGARSEEQARIAILHHYPNIKLIFIARDPLDRLESSFREFHHSGAKYGLEVPLDFDEALVAVPNLLDDTQYWSRLNNYLNYMDSKNIHIVFLEDLTKNAPAEMKKCFQFLGVAGKEATNATTPQLNRGSSKYYDSKFLRYLRHNALLVEPMRSLGVERQHSIGKAIGLRRKFSGPVEWKSSSVARVVSKLQREVEQFLGYANKPQDYWSRFAEAVKQSGSQC